MPGRSITATAMILAIVLCGPAVAGAQGDRSDAVTTASAAHPTVVELFQSQGCSSCPPANAYLNAIADRPAILALSFAVTYWDQLGWKDIFGSPRFTERQQDYARAGRGQVATPEIIVNGNVAVVGSDRRALDTAVARAGSPHGGPDVSLDGKILRLGAAAPGARSTVWLVRYDPRSRNVPISAGENSGRTLPHRNIVRELLRLGDWSGTAVSFSVPPPRETGLATAFFIQRGSGGPIIASRKF